MNDHVHGNGDSGEGLTGLDLLRAIGEDPDCALVYRGGRVEPGPGRPAISPPGGMGSNAPKEVSRNARREEGEGSPGSATRPGQGPSQRGAAARQGSPGATASVLSASGLTDTVRRDLLGAVESYPQMRIQIAPKGVWLPCCIQPVRGLHDEALLLTWYPQSPSTPPRSWAWWDSGIWIGPRHTNYPDGSICSFEPADWTWLPGQSLVTLLDLNTLWIVRHLHLRYFGCWPGRQVLHTAFERLREQQPEELCGGCESGRRYLECCFARDSERNPTETLGEFLRRMGTLTRTPVASALLSPVF